MYEKIPIPLRNSNELNVKDNLSCQNDLLHLATNVEMLTSKIYDIMLLVSKHIPKITINSAMDKHLQD